MKQEIIDKVLKYGVKISDNEYRFVLPNVELHPHYAEALTELAVCFSEQGDTFLMTKWKDYRYNDLTGELELFDDALAGWVEYEEISPSELDVLTSIDAFRPNVRLTLRGALQSLEDEFIYFGDENYESDVKLTIEGKLYIVRDLTIITPAEDIIEPMGLSMRVTRVEDNYETQFYLPITALEKMDNREVTNLLHELYREIPCEDAGERDEEFYQLIKTE